MMNCEVEMEAEKLFPLHIPFVMMFHRSNRNSKTPFLKNIKILQNFESENKAIRN